MEGKTNVVRCCIAERRSLSCDPQLSEFGTPVTLMSLLACLALSRLFNASRQFVVGGADTAPPALTSGWDVLDATTSRGF